MVNEIEKLNEINNRVTNNKGIYFSRVPQKEWEWFSNWAKTEFEGDYGMALKWLVQGYMPPDEVVLFEELEDMKLQIKELQTQLMLLQNNNASEKKRVIKTLGGKEINKGTGEN
jgi:predicted FMN-binding regulatory protein PaiB